MSRRFDGKVIVVIVGILYSSTLSLITLILCMEGDCIAVRGGLIRWEHKIEGIFRVNYHNNNLFENKEFGGRTWQR